jgi:iron complex outermembrane receptor protein
VFEIKMWLIFVIFATMLQYIKLFCLFSTFCMLGVGLRAQVFNGIVKDIETNLPIPNVNVIFVELDAGTATNESGVFFIEHYPRKKIHLQFSCIGYKSVVEAFDLSVLHKKIFYLNPSHIDLEEVVVSVPTGKLQRENMIPIERIRVDQISPSRYLTLAQAITGIPGVNQKTTGTGIGKPVIRGLAGNRVITYAQGIRVENQQWGDEHGLGVGESGIESIEVIKGPASLLYGSDALGGVLYLADERYAHHNRIEGTVGTRFHSNTRGSMSDIGLKWHRERWKANVFGAIGSHTDYQIPTKNRIHNTRFDEKNIKAALGYNKNHWISNLRYSFLENQFGIYDGSANSSSTKRNPELPFQKVTHHLLSLENNFFLNNSRLGMVLGYNNNLRNEYEDDREAPALAMLLQTSTIQLKWHSPTYRDSWNLITGIQGMYQTNVNSGAEFLIPDATTTDLGGFTLVQFNLEKIQFQGGMRLDFRFIDTHAMISESHRIPALSTTFNSINFSGGLVYPLNNVTISANLSSGFRAPNTSELLSYGVHEGTNRFEIGNAALESEKATQWDISLDYQNDHFHFTLNPFYNSIKNFIYLSPTDTFIDQKPVFTYLKTKATLLGGEVGLHWHPHQIHWLHIESSLATVIAEDVNKHALPLIPATQLNTKLKAELTAQSKGILKDIFVQHLFKFKQNRTGAFESPTDAIHLINLGLTMDVKSPHFPLEITAGVNNLLNTKYIDHLSRFKTDRIPNPGINVFAGIRFRFEKAIKTGVL